MLSLQPFIVNFGFIRWGQGLSRLDSAT